MRFLIRCLLLSVAVALIACAPPNSIPPTVGHMIVIQYRMPTPQPDTIEVLKELGRLANTSPPKFLRPMSGRAYVYRFELNPDQKVSDLLSALRKSDKIEYVEPDIVVKTQ